jgi:hypothetical protein
MSRSHIRTPLDIGGNGTPGMELTLRITDPIVVAYFGRFEGDERIDKAQTALRFGVIAMQSASPTLDTQIVQEKFADMEQELREQVVHFVKELAIYLKDKDGVLPRSLEAVFGDQGKLAQHFGRFFDPAEGKLVGLIDSRIGPASPFGKSLDPKNKEGILSLIEKTVRDQVDKKLDELLGELSLDEKDSAMYRIHEMLAGKLGEIKEAIGIQKGEQKEAQRGHVKGFSFQEDLYDHLAEWGRELGDETEFVANTPNRGSKDGDHVITLGETSGAPGLRLVVEVKDQPLKCRKAVEELQDAKANRRASIGIFVYAKGCEPPEVGDFKKIGDDFFCTVNKDALQSGGSLLFFESAYKIARAVGILQARRETAGKLDVEKIQAHIEAMVKGVQRLAELAKKARSVKKHGDDMENELTALQNDLARELQEIMQQLDLDQAA